MTQAHEPSFVGIGMAKSGTTWLDSVLRQHSDIWMPPVKELHFFNDYFRHVALGDGSRYFCREPYSRNRWRRYLKFELKRALRYPSTTSVKWACRFLFGKRTFDHYRSLFFPARGKVAGEITPEYALLGLPQIREIGKQFPHLKAILILRNPVERAWSHVKMEMAGRQGRSISSLQTTEIEDILFRDGGVEERSRYGEIIERWRTGLGADRLFVGLYDDIVANPDALIRSLFEFIGVDPAQAASFPLNEVVFKGKEGALPPALRVRLREHYLPQIEATGRMIGRDDLVHLWT